MGGEVDVELKWAGGPTRGSLRELRLEARTPNWDQDVAAQVLQLIGDGYTLTKACEMIGFSRAVVISWRRLVPEFDAWVAELETALGAYHRDMAEQESDPAMLRGKLALAAAFDRRISKGESEVSVAQGINVTVNW